jgi:hypothetical protein
MTPPTRPTYYVIRIEGHLAQHWNDWFEGLSITLEAGGETLLTGPIVDQAALHGILRKVRDLGMPLIAVMQIGPQPNTERDDSQPPNKETQS